MVSEQRSAVERAAKVPVSRMEEAHHLPWVAAPGENLTAEAISQLRWSSGTRSGLQGPRVRVTLVGTGPDAVLNPLRLTSGPLGSSVLLGGDLVRHRRDSRQHIGDNRQESIPAGADAGPEAPSCAFNVAKKLLPRAYGLRAIREQLISDIEPVLRLRSAGRHQRVPLLLLARPLARKRAWRSSTRPIRSSTAAGGARQGCRSAQATDGVRTQQHPVPSKPIGVSDREPKAIGPGFIVRRACQLLWTHYPRLSRHSLPSSDRAVAR